MLRHCLGGAANAVAGMPRNASRVELQLRQIQGIWEDSYIDQAPTMLIFISDIFYYYLNQYCPAQSDGKSRPHLNHKNVRELQKLNTLWRAATASINKRFGSAI